jgi:two-component system, sensor histidine kinase ChiS
MDQNSPEATYATPAQPHLSPTQESDGRDDEVARLRARVAELQRERDHLVAIVDILQEISSSLHFVDILQAIARKLGDAFGLDRCAIFLSTEQNEVRLVASYEDPTIRNLVVDLNRYPELKRALDSGETVFIPDAASDPQLRSIKGTLDTRNVRSIVVVPIQWQSTVIGAIFLRTDRDAEPFSDADVRFCQVVASLTAKALRNAHRFEALLKDQKDATAGQRRSDLQRVALIAFIRRLLDRYTKSDDHAWAETLLPKASDEELDRLVTVAMQVIDEEAKG